MTTAPEEAAAALPNGNKSATTDGASYTLRFDEPGSCTKALVGGKGANLGLLTQAKFPVPPGFNITTSAYHDFVRSTDLNRDILRIVDTINYDDADDLEAKTAQARELVLATALPAAISDAISQHYTSLGDDGPFVAVRSSGTAEDLAEASFAGLHDTLLDIRGAEQVVDAVRECWASLWSGRAVSYRRRNGFEHGEVELAVVIQRMVRSEASGVLFTGNPLTTATDEVLINSSWGLGEAVVSGIITPDNYILKAGDVLRVREKVLGAKELKIRRDQSKLQGTLTEENSEEERARFSLTDEQAIRLARLGLRVQEHYDGFPQDIEWGYESGTFYLLQSRPITGVEFSWDADCEDWQVFPEDENTTWTRSLAQENWTGAISPLMYSTRGFSWQQGHEVRIFIHSHFVKVLLSRWERERVGGKWIKY
jgi:phosphoenolpyruvate synthase/pyruvate phosphate dikinase